MKNNLLNNGIAITFLGHSCFKLVSPGGSTIIIDPWISGNPKAPADVKSFATLDFILITHAHGDHIGDAVALAKATGAVTVSMPEIAHYLVKKGVDAHKAIGMNKGGTVRCGDSGVTMVHALHSSSIEEGDNLIYGGEAAGFVVRFDNGGAVYHAGDTGVFSDMKIIGELYRPDVALLPIGDHYVMSPQEAAYACKLLAPHIVIPMHYGTFPVLTGTPEELQALMTDMPTIPIVVLQPGETLT